jgi:ABC-type lipoprotein export system ATPase subunit
MDLLAQQAQDTGAALLIATHDHRITDRFDSIIDLGHTLKEAA